MITQCLCSEYWWRCWSVYLIVKKYKMQDNSCNLYPIYIFTVYQLYFASLYTYYFKFRILRSTVIVSNPITFFSRFGYFRLGHEIGRHGIINYSLNSQKLLNTPYSLCRKKLSTIIVIVSPTPKLYSTGL